MQELVELGVAWLWLGLESPHSSYAKLQNVNTRTLVEELRQHGIRVLGSTIVGLEHHTPENIPEEIEYAVSHASDFHQFMLYTPVPGTPLHAEMKEQGRLLDEVELADIHGQYKFNFHHAAISRDDSKKFLDWAFLRDFERNGPSLYRMCQTLLQGWQRYKDCGDERVRRRFEWEARQLKSSYSAALWAMERRLKETNLAVSRKVRRLRLQVEQEFGCASHWAARFLGPVLLWSSRREARRLAAGRTYEPPSKVERRNWASS
jgi:radical SAM superfamily enzyme YgiQ (UPF0313 family)